MPRRLNDPHDKLAQIQYYGLQGISKDCKQAVVRLVLAGAHISLARILTCDNRHSFLLTVGVGDVVAIKSGFASGYGGEGPAAFAYILLLLDSLDVDIQEFHVKQTVLNRLDASALTKVDLSRLSPRRAIHGSWPDYISEHHWSIQDNGQLWSDFPLAVPFAIVDRRLIDLALAFWKDPDAKILTAYRRLEDTVRSRSGFDEHGARLFSQAFAGPQAPLSWPDLADADRGSRAQLFSSVFSVYRNRRAHQEPNDDRRSQLAEFLLINHLFRLESAAIVVSQPADAGTASGKGKLRAPAR